MRLIAGAGLLAVMVVPAPAASQRRTVPDSATRAELESVLLALRDTVDHVSARINEFRRDLPTVGATTVVARAGRLDGACRTARTALLDARPRLSGARLASGQRGARDSLLTAIGTLAASLERDCERGLGPSGPGSRADTLRAWGLHRTSLLTQAMSGYYGAAARLARRLDVDLTKR